MGDGEGRRGGCGLIWVTQKGDAQVGGDNQHPRSDWGWEHEGVSGTPGSQAKSSVCKKKCQRHPGTASGTADSRGPTTVWVCLHLWALPSHIGFVLRQALARGGPHSQPMPPPASVALSGLLYPSLSQSWAWGWGVVIARPGPCVHTRSPGWTEKENGKVRGAQRCQGC
jgi:hypothetical protein